MDTSARAQDFNPLSISAIGEGLTITGNVTSKGAIHLDGQVQGDVHCVALVLGENAQLEGSVVAEDVMVRGRLIGSVRALRVTLQSKSHVEGNFFHKSFSIEQDTHFEGEFVLQKTRYQPAPKPPQWSRNQTTTAVLTTGTIAGL